MLEDPRIKLYHQSSSRFYGTVAYDAAYQGILSATEEGRRLGELLGDYEVMMMQNHGSLTIGNTVAMAFDLMYFLERVCMFQVMANTDLYFDKSELRLIKCFVICTRTQQCF